MRSDVKIGLGVGALLLVIIVAYLGTHPGEKKGEDLGTTAANKPVNTSATPDTTPPIGSPSTAPPATQPMAASAVETSPTGTISIGGPTTAPAAALAGGTGSSAISGSVGPTTAPSPPDSGATASTGGKNVDWDSLLSKGSAASAAGHTNGTLSDQGGTSTASLYASSASPTDTTSGTSASTGSTGSTGRSTVRSNSGPTTAPAGKHVIKRGETLSSIAAATYGSVNYWPAILRANPGLNPNALKAGQTINLPESSAVKTTGATAVEPTPAPSGSTLVADPTKEYSVQQGDSLYAISTKLYGTPNKAEQIYQLNKATIGPSMSRLKVHMVLKLPSPPTSRPA